MKLLNLKRKDTSLDDMFHAEYVQLGWKIIYHKCLYYYLGHRNEFNHLRVEDDEFDRMLKRYKKLCKKLGKDGTADCVEFDINKPSHHAAFLKVLQDHYYHTEKKAKKEKKKK